MCLTEICRETRFSLGFTFTVSTEDGLWNVLEKIQTISNRFFNIVIMYFNVLLIIRYRVTRKVLERCIVPTIFTIVQAHCFI